MDSKSLQFIEEVPSYRWWTVPTLNLTLVDLGLRNINACVRRRETLLTHLTSGTPRTRELVRDMGTLGFD